MKRFVFLVRYQGLAYVKVEAETEEEAEEFIQDKSQFIDDYGVVTENCDFEATVVRKDSEMVV